MEMAEADDTNYSRRVTKSTTSTNSELESHIEQGKEKNIFKRVTRSRTKASYTEQIVKYYNNEENNEETVSFVDKEDKGATRSVNSNLESYIEKNKGKEDENRRVTRSMTKAIRIEDNFKHQTDEANNERIVTSSEKEDENKDDIIKASLSEEISHLDGNEDQEKANSINESLFIKSKKKEDEHFSVAESEEQLKEEDIGVTSRNEKNIDLQANLFTKEESKEKLVTTKETLDFENEDRRIKSKEDEEADSVTEKSEKKQKENFFLAESEKQNEESNNQQEDTGVATISHNEEITNIQSDQLGNEENKEITITTKGTEYENEDRTEKTYQHEGVDVNKNEERLEVNITQPNQNKENFNYKSNECEDKEKTSFVNEKSEIENESGLTKWQINENKIISDTEKDKNEVKCITSVHKKNCVNLNNNSIKKEERETKKEEEATISDVTKKEQTEKKEITKNTAYYASQLLNNLYFEDNTASASQKNVTFDTVFDKSAKAKETTTSDNTKNFENDEDETVKRCQEKEDTIFSNEKKDYNEEIRFTRSTSQYEDCINLKDSLTKVSQNKEMYNSQSDIKKEMISSNKVDDALKDKKSTKCDSQIKDVIITNEEDIKDEELKSTENLLYTSKSKFSIMGYKPNFEPWPTNSEDESINCDELYEELKKQLSDMSWRLECGLKKGVGKERRLPSNLIFSANKNLENIMKMKKRLSPVNRNKLQGKIDKLVKRFKDYGFGKEIEVDQNKDYCQMQETFAGCWGQSKELSHYYSLDRQFQKLSTRSESHSIDMEQGTDSDICHHPHKATATSTVCLNETKKKDQNKNTNTPRVHSYTSSTVTHSSHQKASVDSTVIQLDQACQTSFCEEQKNPPRMTKPLVDKDHPNDDVARRIRNSSPKKEVQNATSSCSMLKSSKEVRNNPLYTRACDRIAQNVQRENSQNKNVKSFQTVGQPNYEMKDSKSYLKSSSCNKTAEDMRNLSARTKSPSDQVMESVESNALTPENYQIQHTLIRQQKLLQDESERVKYFNQPKDNSQFYLQSSRHEEKMDLQDKKVETEERSKEIERHIKTDSEYTSVQTFIQQFQQQHEEKERHIFLLEYYKQQLEQQQNKSDEKIYMDNSVNYNTRPSVELRGLEKQVNSRSHPLSIDDKRKSPQIHSAHAYKKNYLKDSASLDFEEGAVSYHLYQHRKSPEIVNMSSYQQRASLPSFVNQHENVQRKQQITPTPSSRNYHHKEQEYQDFYLYSYTKAANNEEKIMKEFQVPRQQYQTNYYSHDNRNNQAYFNEEQQYIQGSNYQQQHQKRSLESQNFSHGHIFHEGPEMMRPQEIEVAQEVEEEPLEIVDVHQYFSGDYDLKTLDDSVDIKTQIETVDKWAQTFEDKVNTFSGEKFSLEYFVLDEKLMRLIEHLDKLKCHEDQATTARKIEVIQYIKKLHSILDSNAKDE